MPWEAGIRFLLQVTRLKGAPSATESAWGKAAAPKEESNEEDIWAMVRGRGGIGRYVWTAGESDDSTVYGYMANTLLDPAQKSAKQ